MAFTDQNLVITPNIGSSSDVPKIVFSGANASTTAQNITLRTYPQNSGTLSFEGSAGQLFSVANTMSGTIFSVNDVSGIPSIEVLDTGAVKVAQYSGNVLLGTGTDNGTDKLQVSGTICATGIKVSGSFCSNGICSTGAVSAATCVTAGTSMCAGTTIQAAQGIYAGGLICACSGNITTACCVCAGGCIVSPQAYLGCICTQSGGIISCTYICSLTGNICTACCFMTAGGMCSSGPVTAQYIYSTNWGCSTSGWCTGGIVCGGNCIMGNIVCGVIGICSSCCICAANYISAGTCMISPVVCATSCVQGCTLAACGYCCGGGICLNWAQSGWLNMFTAASNVLCICGSGASGCGAGFCASCFVSAPTICGFLAGCACCAYCSCIALCATNACYAGGLCCSATLLACATESNSIYISAPAYTTNCAVKLLNFDWYGNCWAMGNLRSGATPSAGFGILFCGTQQAAFYGSGSFCACGCVATAGMLCAGTCILGNSYLCVPNCVIAGGTLCGGSVYTAGCIQGSCVMGSAMICSATCLYSPCHYATCYMCSAGWICAGCCIYAGAYSCAGICLIAPIVCGITAICSANFYGTFNGSITCAYCSCCALYALCSVPGVNFNVNCCILAQGGICTNSMMCAASTIQAASGVYGAFLCSCGRVCIAPQSAVNCLCCANFGAIEVTETSPSNSGCWFIPGYHQVSTLAGYGYRQHLTIGQYRPANGAWGAAFIGVGGNDSYPTVFWCFDYGGSMCGQGSITSGGWTYACSGVCSTGMICSSTCIYGPCHYATSAICSAGGLCSGGSFCSGGNISFPTSGACACGGCFNATGYFYGCNIYGYATAGTAICSCANICSLAAVLSAGMMCSSSCLYAPCFYSTSVICSAGYICAGCCIYAGAYSCAGTCVIAPVVCGISAVCSGAIYGHLYGCADCSYCSCCALYALCSVPGVNFRINCCLFTSGITTNQNGDASSAMIAGISYWTDPSGTTSWSGFKNSSSVGWGNHGSIVGGEYATYYVMDTTARGWIWRDASRGVNHTSISNCGVLCSSCCISAPALYATSCICSAGGIIASSNYLCSYANTCTACCTLGLGMFCSQSCMIAQYMYPQNWGCAASGWCTGGYMCASGCIQTATGIGSSGCVLSGNYMCTGNYLQAAGWLYGGSGLCSCGLICGQGVYSLQASGNLYLATCGYYYCFGPLNSSWTHHYTNAGGHYFYQGICVQGTIGATGGFAGCASCSYCSCCALYACCSVPGANFCVNCCVMSSAMICSGCCLVAPCSIIYNCNTACGPSLLWANWNTGQAYAPNYCTYCPYTGGGRGHRGWAYGYDGYSNIVGAGMGNSAYGGYPGGYPGLVVCGGCDANFYTAGGGAGIVAYGGAGSYHASGGAGIYAKGGCNGVWGGPNQTSGGLDCGYSCAWAVYGDGPVFGTMICASERILLNNVCLYGGNTNLLICSAGYWYCTGALNSSWVYNNTNVGAGHYYYNCICSAQSISALYLCAGCCVYAGAYSCAGICMISPYVCGYNYVMGCCGYFTTCACTNGGFIAAGYICSYACLCALNMIHTNGCVIADGYLYTSQWMCAGAGVCTPGYMCVGSFVQAQCLYAPNCICTNNGFIAAGYICSYTCACILNMVHTNGCVIADGYMYAGGWVCAGYGFCTGGYICVGGGNCIISSGYIYSSGWMCAAGGLCTPNYICSAGTIYSASNIVAYNGSDCRLKKCITPITCALDKLNQISGVEFTWNDDVVAKESIHGRSYFRADDVGVIAQEVESVMPRAVINRDDGYKGVSYERLIPLLIQAIKEQQKDITEIREIIGTSKFN